MSTTVETSATATSVGESLTDSDPTTTAPGSSTDPTGNGCPLEVCDGEDNDCDGVIDEWSDANPQCNDCSAIVDRDTVYYLCGLDADWFGAQEHCEQFGAQLVTLFDPETNELVRNAATDAGLAEVWIGLSDLTLEGEFVWVDGSRMTFDNFNDGQPDDFKMAEDCVEMEPAGPVSGLWNDIPCDLPLTAFICEGPAS